MRKLLAYVLCFMQVYGPLPALAMEASNAAQTTVLSPQRAETIRIAEGGTQAQPAQPRDVKAITLKKSAAGDFRMDLDPSLLQDNLTLYLLYGQGNDRAFVGQVTYRPVDQTHQLTLQTWGDHKVNLSAVANFHCPSLAVLSEGGLHLRGKISTDLVYFQGKEGSTEKGAEVRAKGDLMLSGFEKFDHAGTFLSCHHLLFQKMGAYRALAGSEALALGLAQIQAKSVEDNGITYASLSRIQADNASFGATYKFIGDRQMVNGKGRVETKPGSHVQATLSAALDCSNELVHDGLVDQNNAGGNFPLDRFLDAPLPKSITSLQYRQLMAPVSGLKTKAMADAMGNAAGIKYEGIYLSGANRLVGAGHLKTPTGDVALSGAKVHFRGDSQSGFSKGNETIINALDAVLTGIMKARKLQANIGHSLEIPGTIVAKSVRLYFPEPPKPVAQPTPAPAPAAATKPAAAPAKPADQPKPAATPATAPSKTVESPKPAATRAPAAQAQAPKPAVAAPAQPPKPAPQPAPTATPATATPAAKPSAPQAATPAPATSLVIPASGTVTGKVKVVNPTDVNIAGKILGMVDEKPVPVSITGGQTALVSGTVLGSNATIQTAEKVHVTETGVVKAIPVEPAVKPATQPLPAAAPATSAPAQTAPAQITATPTKAASGPAVAKPAQTPAPTPAAASAPAQAPVVAKPTPAPTPAATAKAPVVPTPAPVVAQPQPAPAPAPKKEEGKPTGQVTLVSKEVIVDGKPSGGVVAVEAKKLTTGEKSEITATKLIDLQANTQTLAGKAAAPVVVSMGQTLETKPTSTIAATEKVVLKHEESVNLDGAIKAPTATVVVDAPKVAQSGTVEAKDELIKAQELTQTSSASNKAADQLQIEAQQSTLAGKNTAAVAVVDSPVCHVPEGGVVSGTQATQVTAPTNFDNQGQVGADSSATALKVGATNHVGEVRGNLTLDTPTPYDVNAILAGQHPELTAKTQSFQLVTPHPVLVGKAANLAKPFGVKAPSVRVTKPLTSSSDWIFETTQGDLLLEAAVNGHGVKLWSARGLKTRNVGFSAWADFYATGDYHNMGQVEGAAGSSLNVSAASVLNATIQSILRADKTLVEARDGSIQNWNLIQGRVFADVNAKGDVVNHVTKSYLPGGKHHGPIPQFHQANIIGGTGITYTDQDGNERKLGLRVVAGNNIINNAGGLSSGADRYLEANGSGPAAIQHNAFGEKYVKYRKSKRHGVCRHKKKTVTEIDTVTATPLSMVAGHGVSNTPNSGVRYTGCREFGTDGDEIFGKGSIEFYSLITEHQRTVKKSSGYGLKKSKLKIKEQGAAPTVFVNKGPINHTSFDGAIYGRGVQIHAPSYTPQAKNGIRFKNDVLKYSVRQKTSALMPTFFGSSALSGQPLGKALVNSDPFTANLYGLANATGSGNRLVAGISAAMDLWNTGSKVAETLNANGDPTNILLSRVANVGLGYTKTSLRIDGTRSNPTVIDVGTFTPISEKGIDLLGGTQVRVGVLFNPKAPYMKLGYGTEEVHTRFKSTGFEVGYNFATETPNASVSGSRSRSDATSYLNALIQVGDEGHVDLSGLKRLELDGGNIVTPTISGHVPVVVVTSHQDRMDSKSSGFSVGGSGFGGPNPTGSASFSRSSAHSRTTNQHSGIKASKGFGQDFSIDRLTVSDTELDPALAATAKETDFVQIYDSNKSTTLGITLSNLNLSSPGNFADSLGRSALVMGAGFAAAEVARGLGAGDFGTSLAGTLGAAAMGHQINGANYFGEASEHANTPGLSSLGTVTYGRNGKTTTYMGLNINGQQLAREWGEIQDFFAPEHDSVPDFGFAPHAYDDVEDQAAELLAAQLAAEMQKEEPVVQLWDESALTEEPQSAQSRERDSQPQVQSDSSRDEHEDRADRQASKKTGSKAKAEKNSDRKIISAGSDSEKSSQQDKDSTAAQTDEHTYGDLHGPLSEMRRVYRSFFGEPPSPTEPTLERRCPELVRSTQELNTLSEQYDRGQVGFRDMIIRGVLTMQDLLGSGIACAGRSFVGTPEGQKAIQLTAQYFRITEEDARTLWTISPAAIGMAKQPTRLWNNLSSKNFMGRGFNPKRPANHNYVPFVKDGREGAWYSGRHEGSMVLEEVPVFNRAISQWKEVKNAPFLVVGHGHEDIIAMQTGKGQFILDHRALARLLRNDPNIRPNQPIQLISCLTGKNDFGFAQNLANKTGRIVEAPTDILWIRGQGSFYVGPHYPNNGIFNPPQNLLGQMKRFYPGNSGKPHSSSKKITKTHREPDGKQLLQVDFFRNH